MSYFSDLIDFVADFLALEGFLTGVLERERDFSCF